MPDPHSTRAWDQAWYGWVVYFQNFHALSQSLGPTFAVVQGRGTKHSMGGWYAPKISTLCVIGRAHEGRSGRLLGEKQICPRSSTKPGRPKIPTFCQRISRSRQAPRFHNHVRDPSLVASFSLKAHATVIKSQMSPSKGGTESVKRVRCRQWWHNPSRKF